MLIKHLEIANFRKLLAVRIDLADETTVFVGANNSGKTSAMLALRRFLVGRRNQFDIHDLTLCHWAAINEIGREWIRAQSASVAADLTANAWIPLMPALDLWLSVEADELHHVSKLLPTLDWSGGLLGIRLRLEPDDVSSLHKAFMEAHLAAEVVNKASVASDEEGEAPKTTQKLTLWPNGLMDFLSRRLPLHFKIRAYPLDPGQLAAPVKAVAKPQTLPPGISPLDDPLAGLIRVNEINAQRGFGEAPASEDEEDGSVGRSLGKLSEQLRGYYQKHLDPSEHPEAADIAALQAIESAQSSFDKKLADSFKAAFAEVAGLGYPGVTDPRPVVATRLRPVDGLKHQSAVTFEVDVVGVGTEAIPMLRLPEDNNGLGYQNLISMIFRLMSFRDAWMRVGKAAKAADAMQFEPLHLVLVEEPEAHLHAQVQQVFIKKAYSVLRAHSDLGDKKQLQTQMLVSTHSGHVTHETPYSSLRYFRRLPAGMHGVRIPVSVVINLTDAFGETDETTRFVTRYLRTQHADIFFADALILVEGPAERMLLPHFILRGFPIAHQGYITLLEVGGSHAHRLQSLVEKLGLITLIVTDLDAQKARIIPATETKKERTVYDPALPCRGAGQSTNNDTIKTWWPKKNLIDDLLAPNLEKVSVGDDLFSVYVAYQQPIQVVWPENEGTSQEALPYTFEDALALTNPGFFASLSGPGLARKFREALTESNDVTVVGGAMFEALQGKNEKASFALTILDAPNFGQLKTPAYIAEGLSWLEKQVQKKQVEVLATETVVANG